jgi:glycosyltransferase involved in cell wall biosynthesis
MTIDDTNPAARHNPATMDRPAPAPLLAFHDDWGRHPSSSQHLVRQLLRRRRVLWVNTIGTRRPTLSVRDARRAAEKLRAWLLPRAGDDATHRVNGAAAAPEPIVISPPMWPDFATAASRAINAALLTRSIERAVARHFDATPAVFTAIPIIADVVPRLRARRCVYHCVDDWSAWPGADHDALVLMERRLLDRVDAVAAVSEALCDRLERQTGRRPTLVRHGVDIDHWRAPLGPAPASPVLAQLDALPRPRAVFWGLVDGRLDRAVLRDLAAHERLRLALVGPVDATGDDVRALHGLTLTGPAPFALLPHVAARADVLVMPYRADADAARFGQQLKLLEYLATDRPAVCTDLPAAGPWDDCCDVVAAPVFAARVIERAETGLLDAQRSRRGARLPAESWAARAAQVEALLDG